MNENHNNNKKTKKLFHSNLKIHNEITLEPTFEA